MADVSNSSSTEPTLEEIQEMINNMNEEMMKLINSPFTALVLEAIKYPNFEAVQMRQMIMKKVDVRDVVFLCNMGLRFGNNTNRIISGTRNAAIRNRLIRLKNRLQIKDTTMNDPNILTLSRVLACFPEAAVGILHVYNPPMKIPHEELKRIHEEFPSAARTPVAASILPYSLTKRDAQHALALITVSSLKTSELINGNSAKWVAKTRNEKVDTTLEYVMRCFNADVLSKELRVSEAIKFGIVENNGGELALTAAWRAAGAAAAAWLKSKYDFDMTETLNTELLMGKVKTEPTH